jgi:multicomponent Na+:H+ antiporter subunit E
MSRNFVRALFRRTLLLGGVWVILAGTEPKGLAFGAVSVPVAVWLSMSLLPAHHELSVWRLVRHIPVFLLGSLSGGWDVARRALSPRLRLQPGWVEVPVTLPDGGRAVMGGELSLMPGTLAAGTRDGRLLVHLLDTGAGFEHAIPQEEAAIAMIILGRDREVPRS